MDTQEKIKQQVTGNPVVLYMKGTPQFPQCGFSALAVQALNACGVKNFFSVNVLENPTSARASRNTPTGRPSRSST
jgi:monothiol glutaredoxin